MLVLTRKTDESITLDNGKIVFTILGIEGDKVKIGISAPREISILRSEVFQAIQDQTLLQEKLASEDVVSPVFESLRELLNSEIEENSAPSEPAPKTAE